MKTNTTTASTEATTESPAASTTMPVAAKTAKGSKHLRASEKAARTAAKAKPAKTAPKAKPAKATKATKKATATKPATSGTSKKDAILALISRKNGATLDEIMTATGWQKHSVRGAIATMGKTTKIVSSKSEAGARTYKA